MAAFLRLEGNPICKNASIQNVGQFCQSEAGDGIPDSSTNSTQTMTCPIQACPLDNFYEYVPSSPLPCFCASPIIVEYRLKSPSFSYFPAYIQKFEIYLTRSLDLSLYQLSIDSFVWQEGPRLWMHLKFFPMFINPHPNTFNISEVDRIRGVLTSWGLPLTDFFGPYELLNFTLLGPYSNSMYFSLDIFVSSHFGLIFEIMLHFSICTSMHQPMSILVSVPPACHNSSFLNFILEPG